MLGCVLAGRDTEYDAVRNNGEGTCEEGGEGGGEDGGREGGGEGGGEDAAEAVVRGRCDQAECRQPAPILIRLLPADTAPLGHGAHTPDTSHTATLVTTCSIKLPPPAPAYSGDPC